MATRNPYSAPQTNVTRGDVDPDEEHGELKVFSARGRLGRVRYIGYSFGISILIIVALLVLAGLASLIDPTAALLVVVIGYVALIVVQFLLTIQRAHDMNVTGWLSLILFVPLAFLVFWLVPGTRGENDYGKPPPPNSGGAVVLACLLPVFMVVGGMLAAIALPAYQDYTIRAQVSEGLNMAAGIKADVMEAYGRTGAAPADRLAAGLSADPTDTSGLYVDSIDVAKGTIVITYGGNANESLAGGVLAMRPYVMSDKSVVWRCGQGPVPGGAMPMDASATPFTADIMPAYLPSACRP